MLAFKKLGGKKLLRGKEGVIHDHDIKVKTQK